MSREFSITQLAPSFEGSAHCEGTFEGRGAREGVPSLPDAPSIFFLHLIPFL